MRFEWKYRSSSMLGELLIPSLISSVDSVFEIVYTSKRHLYQILGDHNYESSREISLHVMDINEFIRVVRIDRI
ncbi:hypothetical protein SAMN05428962_5550 [Paenibacillus sp. BC26]|nr:hypothetical protein SAMN05428962_5550 [Paenibacillus sp. BC26]